ncbi:MAG: phosphatase PAP2 family protein [Nitrososphaerota archaeon]|nr:phosphatase PAP2 family protein [Nitrososphaerota archaeon]
MHSPTKTLTEMRTINAQTHRNRNIMWACIGFFIAFILFTLLKTNLQSLDIAVNLWVIPLHNDTAIFLAKGLSVAFDTSTLVIATLIISIYLVVKKRMAQSLLFATTVSGTALFATIIKNLTQVARPANQLLQASGFSYPSGHCAGAIVFIGLIIYFIWSRHAVSQRVKALSFLSYGLIVVFVSFDRVYLNVHWLSDVIGGCLFGAFWLLFCIIIYERLKSMRPELVQKKPHTPSQPLPHRANGIGFYNCNISVSKVTPSIINCR